MELDGKSPSAGEAKARHDSGAGWFIYTIKQTELGLRGPTEAVAQQVGVTTAQFTALAVLERWPGITSSELARRSFVRAQTMAENVSFLVEAEYIWREKDPSNLRRYRLFITSEGNRVLSSGQQAMHDLETKLLASFSPTERKKFANYLRACREALSELPR